MIEAQLLTFRSFVVDVFWSDKVWLSSLFSLHVAGTGTGGCCCCERESEIDFFNQVLPAFQRRARWQVNPEEACIPPTKKQVFVDGRQAPTESTHKLAWSIWRYHEVCPAKRTFGEPVQQLTGWSEWRIVRSMSGQRVSQQSNYHHHEKNHAYHGFSFIEPSQTKWHWNDHHMHRNWLLCGQGLRFLSVKRFSEVSDRLHSWYYSYNNLVYWSSTFSLCVKLAHHISFLRLTSTWSMNHVSWSSTIRPASVKSLSSWQVWKIMSW